MPAGPHSIESEREPHGIRYSVSSGQSGPPEGLIKGPAYSPIHRMANVSKQCHHSVGSGLFIPLGDTFKVEIQTPLIVSFL